MCRIKEVEAFQAMGAMITTEADSMSAMRFRMMKADRVFWTDFQFYKNEGIAEGRKHKRYREVVQPRILHSCEGWGWKQRDVLQGWERWWDSCKGWENFVSAAEELCQHVNALVFGAFPNHVREPVRNKVFHKRPLRRSSVGSSALRAPSSTG